MKWRTKKAAPVSKDYRTTFYHPEEHELVEDYKAKRAASDSSIVERFTLPIILGADFMSKMFPIDHTKEDPRDQLGITLEWSAIELCDQLCLTQQAQDTPMGREITRDWNNRQRYVRRDTPLAIVIPSLVLPELEVVS